MAEPGRLRALPWRLRYDYGARTAWELRRLGLLATHLHADVRIERPVRIGPRFALWIPGEGSFHAGVGCDFRRDFCCEISGSGAVRIGAGSIFTAGALVQVSTRLEIGARCVFGQSVMIADGNHRFRDHTRHLLDQGYEYRPITIGTNAVVTSKCTVLASIGAGAVIGAHSVVTRPVPDFCLAVGAPARVVEYFGPPELRPAGLEAPA